MVRSSFRTFFTLLVALGIGVFLWKFPFSQFFESAPCDTPVEYSLGTIDPRFGLSKEALLIDIQKAANLWNVAAGKTVLVYSDKGTIPVNLIYDTRQALTDKNKELVSNITSDKNTAQAAQSRYEELKAQFEKDQSSYMAQKEEYETKLAAYNKDVAYWNAQGGAPEAQYQTLEATKASLESTRVSLNDQASHLQDEVDSINSLITNYNLIVQKVNTTVGQLNSTPHEDFREGEYIVDTNGKRINIYQYSDQEKLLRVLAHELGHALGLDHNTNPSSIMYTSNSGSGLVLSKDDIASLKILCKIPSS